jgi:imidazolonepropionase-like amidohydrolase
MKKVLSSLLFLICAATAMAQELPDSRKQEIVIRNVQVIPMDKEQVLPNQVVVIKDGKVSLMGDARMVKYSKDALVIDGKGKYLLPGLAEMHAHIPPVNDIAPMKEVALLFALKGITTIRGMLGHPLHLQLREQLQQRTTIGPRFYTSGPSVNGQTASTPEIAAKMVRDQKAAGYDFLKLHPGLTKENFAVIAATAKEVGIPFAGHVSFDVGVWRAIDAGYASIDHMDGFVESLVPGIENMTEQQTGLFGLYIGYKADTTRIPKLVNALRDHHIWVVPTQCLAERWLGPDKTPEALGAEPEMIYMARNTVNGWVNTKKNLLANPAYNAEQAKQFVALRRKLINACNKGGVGLLLGSDAPQVFDVPGFSLHHELQYLVDAGLTPYEALRTGTVNPAAYFKRDDIGVVKPGAVADFILLRGNPLKDIKEIGNIEGVMLDGRWLSKEYIETSLKKLEKK